MMTTVTIPSGGASCIGTHFAPTAGTAISAPCIVMAHGFAATREMALEQYARRFARAGFHVLTFDYRHFGESDGEPRQFLSIPRQHEDIASAVTFARKLRGVDPQRVALWGSSLGGGHVVVAAARDPSIVAVVSQCPMMDGFAAARQVIRYAGWWHSSRLMFRAVGDLLRSMLGLAPSYVPVVAVPGVLAAMSSPDAEEGYGAIAPGGFRNEVAARVMLGFGLYRPSREAGKLRCPWLVQICENDTVAPAEAAEAASRRCATAEVVRYPVGHFDVYRSVAFEKSVSDQLAFYERHLLHSVTGGMSEDGSSPRRTLDSRDG